MKKTLKKLAVVILYMLLLCSLLHTEVSLLFSPKHIGMFLLGCLLLCVPYLEKDMYQKPGRWRALEAIFKKNAITAGYLETFMLIFVSMLQERVSWEEVLAELALDLRPLFYGFVCYIILKDEPAHDSQKEIGENGQEETAEEQPNRLDLSRLTRQEKQVAELVKRGLTNREIGEELCISEATVKKHMSNIFEKLGIESRRELR